MKWPPPDGKRCRLLYIPQLGLDHKYRGKPSSREYRYSNQIIEHLLGQAKIAAEKIREDKPPKKHVELLTLRVHRENIPAQKQPSKLNFGPNELHDSETDDAMLIRYTELRECNGINAQGRKPVVLLCSFALVKYPANKS